MSVAMKLPVFITLIVIFRKTNLSLQNRGVRTDCLIIQKSFMTFDSNQMVLTVLHFWLPTSPRGHYEKSESHFSFHQMKMNGLSKV